MFPLLRQELIPLPLVLFIAVSLLAGIPERRQICIHGMPCVETATRSISIEASDAPRAFTWVEPGGGVIGFGVVGSGEAAAVIPTTSNAVELRLSSGDPSRWPVDAVIALRNQQHTWQATVPARHVARVELNMPPGRYEVEVRSPRHVTARSPLVVKSGRSIVPLRLAPMPAITGRVVTKKRREPIAGATISIGGAVAAVSDAAGSFSIDADPDDWPTRLTIAAPGFGTVATSIPPARTSTPLGDVELSSGGAIVATVERPDALDEIRVSLYERDRDQRRDDPAATAVLRKGEPSVRLTDIAVGEYLLLLEGRGAAERYGRKLAIAAGEEKAVDVTLDPMRLVLATELAAASLPHARVELSNADGLWRSDAQTDDAGRAELTIWQAGRMYAVVFAEALTSPHLEKTTLTSGPTIVWRIGVPIREVLGTVVDAATEKPIANASVALRTEVASATTRAGSDGKFRFTAVAPGRHVLMAAADRYVPAERSYLYAEPEQQRELVLRLQAASSRRVVVEDAGGRAVGGAAVLAYHGTTLTGQHFTEGDGAAVLSIPAGESRTVFVVGRDGAFAVSTSRTADDLVVRLPAPRTSIVIETRTEDERPVPNVWVVMRCNGIVIPPEVVQMMSRLHGSQVSSGSAGVITLRHLPAGLYELWPVGSVREMRELMLGLGTDAPVRLFAAEGVHRATMTFQPTGK